MKDGDHQPTRPSKRWLRLLAVGMCVWLLGPTMSMVAQPGFGLSTVYGHESMEAPVNRLAPDPRTYSDPVIQIYAARTWGAKGALAVHTWIATKRRGENVYRIYQVIGWRYRYGGRTPLVVTEVERPDFSWYGNAAQLLLDMRGVEYEAVIDKIEHAVATYPYRDTYTLWPGPNSNTFTAFVARLVPELGLDLPSTAIGKDYRPLTHPVGRSPSRSGLQASLLGLVGVSVGVEEGLEVNILSLNLELDIFDFAVELPGFGRIGPDPVQQ